MRAAKWLILIACIALVVGCGEDNPIRPPFDISPPTNLNMVTGQFSVLLSWDASAYAGAGDFDGYHVYVDTVSIADLSDTTTASTLNARRVTASPITARSFSVNQLAGGSALQQGTMYYFHVRTARSDGRVSVGSNEVDTSPRPQGDNYDGIMDEDLMFDFSAETTTFSGYGWDRDPLTGDGRPYPTGQANGEFIDFFMVEEPTSADDGSIFISPGQASFTQGWPVKNSTLFLDLGAGTDAWETAVAPDTADMSNFQKVELDHTYAVYTHDGYWAKIRVIEFRKNEDVMTTGGGTVPLNRAKFDFAFQLKNDYGRFKPRPSE